MMQFLEGTTYWECVLSVKPVCVLLPVFSPQYNAREIRLRHSKVSRDTQIIWNFSYLFLFSLFALRHLSPTSILNNYNLLIIYRNGGLISQRPLLIENEYRSKYGQLSGPCLESRKLQFIPRDDSQELNSEKLSGFIWLQPRLSPGNSSRSCWLRQWS